MSKIQKHSVEEGIVDDKAKADAEAEINGRVAGTELGMRDGEVLLTAEAGGPLIVGYRILIACICDKKLQNQKLY
jgi:hypothetical protein